VASNQRRRPVFSTPAMVMLAAVLVSGAGLWLLEIRSKEPPALPSGPSIEAKEYTRHLNIIEAHLSEAESFSGHKLVALEGKIKNAGERTVRLVELTCIFQDLAGNVIGRERQAIVKKDLTPGETRDFRLAFDAVPQGWNQRMPQLVIADIEFQQ
jgi:hypothetical protein